jgi:hypothetical protein
MHIPAEPGLLALIGIQRPLRAASVLAAPVASVYHALSLVVDAPLRWLSRDAVHSAPLAATLCAPPVDHVCHAALLVHAAKTRGLPWERVAGGALAALAGAQLVEDVLHAVSL